MNYAPIKQREQNRSVLGRSLTSWKHKNNERLLEASVQRDRVFSLQNAAFQTALTFKG